MRPDPEGVELRDRLLLAAEPLFRRGAERVDDFAVLLVGEVDRFRRAEVELFVAEALLDDAGDAVRLLDAALRAELPDGARVDGLVLLSRADEDDPSRRRPAVREDPFEPLERSSLTSSSPTAATPTAVPARSIILGRRSAAARTRFPPRFLLFGIGRRFSFSFPIERGAFEIDCFNLGTAPSCQDRRWFRLLFPP